MSEKDFLARFNIHIEGHTKTIFMLSLISFAVFFFSLDINVRKTP